MTIQIRLSTAHMTIGDVIRAEDGFKTSRETVEFLSRFVMDENGQPMERGKALELIMALPIGDLPGIVRQLTEQLGESREAAVPLASDAA